MQIGGYSPNSQNFDKFSGGVHYKGPQEEETAVVEKFLKHVIVIKNM